MADVLVTIQSEGDVAPGQELCGLSEAALRRVVALTLDGAGIAQKVELSVLVTDDEALHTLNRDYRGRDTVTDVLSFPLMDAPLVSAPSDELWGAADDDDYGDQEEQDPEGISADRQPNASVVSWEERADADAAEDDETDDTPLPFLLPPDMPPHLGDIVVARGMTIRQADAAEHSPAWELAYLVAHGVLHLIGYDDHTDAGYAAMVRQQEAALATAGIAR